MRPADSFLGIDTSNYTTSAACYHPESNTVQHVKRLLPVRPGALGLRQSDALFHHIRQLDAVLEQTLSKENGSPLAVCASDRPRDAEGSYMPCFLAGKTAGKAAALAARAPFYTVSHQSGHIAAALFSAGHLEMLNRELLAFHVSGGTTELLHVKPHPERVLSVQILAGTLDISAGQLIDRVGVRMGLAFPAGPALEQLALTGARIKPKPVRLSDGSCNLSGIENISAKMLENGLPPADIARFVLEHIAQVLAAMTEDAFARVGELPLLYSGGVLSNTIIKQYLTERYDCMLAAPEFSADNAAGTAILGYLLDRRIKEGAAH